MNNRRKLKNQETINQSSNGNSMFSTYSSETQSNDHILKTKIIRNLQCIIQRKLKSNLVCAFLQLKTHFTKTDKKEISIQKLSFIVSQTQWRAQYISFMQIKKPIPSPINILDSLNKKESNSARIELERQLQHYKKMELSDHIRNQLIKHYKANEKSLSYDKLLPRMQLLRQESRRIHSLKFQTKQNTKVFDNELLLDILSQYQSFIEQTLKQANFRAFIKTNEGRRSQSPIKQQKSVSIKQAKEKEIKMAKQAVYSHLSKGQHRETELIIDNLLTKMKQNQTNCGPDYNYYNEISKLLKNQKIFIQNLNLKEINKQLTQLLQKQRQEQNRYCVKITHFKELINGLNFKISEHNKVYEDMERHVKDQIQIDTQTFSTASVDENQTQIILQLLNTESIAKKKLEKLITQKDSTIQVLQMEVASLKTDYEELVLDMQKTKQENKKKQQMFIELNNKFQALQKQIAEQLQFGQTNALKINLINQPVREIKESKKTLKLPPKLDKTKISQFNLTEMQMMEENEYIKKIKRLQQNNYEAQLKIKELETIGRQEHLKEKQAIIRDYEDKIKALTKYINSMNQQIVMFSSENDRSLHTKKRSSFKEQCQLEISEECDNFQANTSEKQIKQSLQIIQFSDIVQKSDNQDNRDSKNHKRQKSMRSPCQISDSLEFSINLSQKCDNMERDEANQSELNQVNYKIVVKGEKFGKRKKFVEDKKSYNEMVMDVKIKSLLSKKQKELLEHYDKRLEQLEQEKLQQISKMQSDFDNKLKNLIEYQRRKWEEKGRIQTQSQYNENKLRESQQWMRNLKDIVNQRQQLLKLQQNQRVQKISQKQKQEWIKSIVPKLVQKQVESIRLRLENSYGDMINEQVNKMSIHCDEILQLEEQKYKFKILQKDNQIHRITEQYRNIQQKNQTLLSENINQQNKIIQITIQFQNYKNQLNTKYAFQMNKLMEENKMLIKQLKTEIQQLKQQKISIQNQPLTQMSLLQQIFDNQKKQLIQIDKFSKKATIQSEQAYKKEQQYIKVKQDMELSKENAINSVKKYYVQQIKLLKDQIQALKDSLQAKQKGEPVFQNTEQAVLIKNVEKKYLQKEKKMLQAIIDSKQSQNAYLIQQIKNSDQIIIGLRSQLTIMKNKLFLAENIQLELQTKNNVLQHELKVIQQKKMSKSKQHSEEHSRQLKIELNELKRYLKVSEEQTLQIIQQRDQLYEFYNEYKDIKNTNEVLLNQNFDLKRLVQAISKKQFIEKEIVKAKNNLYV